MKTKPLTTPELNALHHGYQNSRNTPISVIKSLLRRNLINNVINWDGVKDVPVEGQYETTSKGWFEFNTHPESSALIIARASVEASQIAA